MVGVKQAVQIAQAKAAEVLERDWSNLEEIERETYNRKLTTDMTFGVSR